MATSMSAQLLGFFLGLLGLAGAGVATLLPHWRRTAYMGSNIITATAYIKGLWMECAWHSTGLYQCEIHRSLLALPPDLQAARALMVLSCFTSALAVLVSSVGMKCTRCGPPASSPAKRALALGGGACFLCAGLLCLVTVAWTTNDVVAEFHSPAAAHGGGVIYELGVAVYLGYASAVLSLTGGAVLCWNSGGGPRKARPSRRRRIPPPSKPAVAPADKVDAPAAPPYRPPAALKDNRRSPSLSSASSDGYRLSDYV